MVRAVINGQSWSKVYHLGNNRSVFYDGSWIYFYVYETLADYILCEKNFELQLEDLTYEWQSKNGFDFRRGVRLQC